MVAARIPDDGVTLEKSVGGRYLCQVALIRGGRQQDDVALIEKAMWHKEIGESGMWTARASGRHLDGKWNPHEG
ncbi:hypothetical protein V6N13_123852 [Hibiscus sabdariffa]